MATYAIGDVQGCFDTLKALLQRVDFRQGRDRLWLVGDLVNRGPKSLDTLRYLRSLGDDAVCVLGNHDLHLLARHAGIAAPKPRDTLDEVLAAPDVEELMDWLASRPLLHQEGAYTLVHAGLLPAWTVADAKVVAGSLEKRLQDKRTRPSMLGKADCPPELKAITTLRTCREDGTLCKHSGPPEAAPPGCVPWFQHPGRQSRGQTVIFGHWAALGVKRGDDFLALDSGCVWGNSLTACRIDDGKVFSEPARET